MIHEDSMKIDSDLRYWNLFIDHLTVIMNSNICIWIDCYLNTCLVSENKHTNVVTMNTEKKRINRKEKNQLNT